MFRAIGRKVLNLQAYSSTDQASDLGHDMAD